MSPPTLSTPTGSTSVTMHISIGTEAEVATVDDVVVVLDQPIDFEAALPVMRRASAVDEPDWDLGSGPLGI